MGKEMLAVFDVGGSHISYGYFNLSSASLMQVGEERAPSLQAGDASPLAVLIDLAEKARGAYGSDLSGLSIAVPGPFDYANGISRMQHKLTSLFGVDLRKALSVAGGVPGQSVTFLNDADAFLLGALHAWGMAGGRAVGITLGTGIGSAFVSGMDILLSGEGVPPGGEIWNLPYGTATVEDAISTRTLEADYEAQSCLHKSVKSIAEAARQGDSIAANVFTAFGARLGTILEHICTAFDPEKIIVGGGIAAAETLFLPAVLSNPWCAERVSISKERETAPLLGAAVSWQKTSSW